MEEIKVDIFIGSLHNSSPIIHQKWTLNSAINDPFRHLIKTVVYSGFALILARFRSHNFLSTWNLDMFYSLENRHLGLSSYVYFFQIRTHLSS